MLDADRERGKREQGLVRAFFSRVFPYSPVSTVRFAGGRSILIISFEGTVVVVPSWSSTSKAKVPSPRRSVELYLGGLVSSDFVQLILIS